jgi:hypothetical protein
VLFVLLGIPLFVILFFVSLWLNTMLWGIVHTNARSQEYGISTVLIALASGLPALLLSIGLVITAFLGFPLMALFLLLWLPGFCYFILSSTVYYALWSPVWLWHSLHYLFVPHPAETAYRTGMAEHVPYPELARTVADAMYQYDLKDFERLPKRWKSKNWQKRIDAFRERLEAEDKFMEELIRNLRLKDQLR